MTSSPLHTGEQRGRRPALVVQNDTGNQQAPSTIVAAITSATLRRPYPFAVPLAAGEGGLPIPGYVNCAHITTIDIGRLGERTGNLTSERMQEVKMALRYQLTL